MYIVFTIGHILKAEAYKIKSYIKYFQPVCTCTQPLEGPGEV